MTMPRGFTFIELLVVVAIIGLIASVVLTSLGSARNKSKDAGVKQNLHTVAVQAGLYFSNNGNYGTAFPAGPCPTTVTDTIFWNDSTIRSAIAAAVAASGGTARCYAVASPASYTVSVGLGTNTATHWCVDSFGTRKAITTLNWSGPGCPTP